MISPTIHFPGNCNEAIAYYEKVFKVTEKQISFYRDAPPNSGITITEDMLDLVMHASITICGTKFNCSDTQEKVVAGNMILFNVFMETEDEVRNAFEILKIDGNVIVDLGLHYPTWGKEYVNSSDTRKSTVNGQQAHCPLGS